MSTGPPREPTSGFQLPLRLGDGTAATVLELTPSGLYFEIEGDRTIVGPLVFEMHLPGTRLKFTAQGEVTRVDTLGNRRGVQVRLKQLRLHSLD